MILLSNVDLRSPAHLNGIKQKHIFTPLLAGDAPQARLQLLSRQISQHIVLVAWQQLANSLRAMLGLPPLPSKASLDRLSNSLAKAAVSRADIRCPSSSSTLLPYLSH